jgi:fatty acid desaturase
VGRSPVTDDDGPPPTARMATAFTIIGAILVAFLYRVVSGGHVPPWLVLLVSVLGIAAGAVVLGSDAVEAGYEVVRGLRGP